jgi:hypothetical protein
MIPLRPMLLAVILVFALLVGRADAGQYTIHNCPASLQSNFNAGPWQSYGGSLPSVGGFQASCTPGSTLGTAIGWYANQMNLNSNLGVMLQSPSGVTIRETRLVWSAYHESSGSDTFAQVTSDAGSELIDPTPYAATFGSPAKVYFPEGTHTVYVYVYCSYNNSTNCYFPSNTSPIIKLEGMDSTLEESTPPTATINGGSLAGSGPVSGNATLQFTATDGESGVREAQLLIDGRPVVSDSYTSQCPYTNFAACPRSQVDAMTWNTGSVADGTHRVALRIMDASGNARTIDDHALAIANAAVAGPPPGGGPSPQPVECAAASGTHTVISVTAKRNLIATRYRHRARIRGRLTGPAGKPLAGVAVEVLTRPLGASAGYTPFGHVTTRAHGQFKLTLPPGISHAICLRYHQLPDGLYTAARVVTQQVSAGVTLAIQPREVEPNGSIVLTGDVLGGYISSAGKVVELQVLYLGRWRVFETLRTKPDGEFTYIYTFLGGHGIFGFRARVRGENGYPYALGYSHVVRIRAG